MEFQTVLQHRTDSIWGYHILVPDTVAQELISKTDRRVKCSLNGIIEIRAALMPNGNGSFFISLNKEVRTKLNLNSGDDILVKLEKDNSQYGMVLPEEMEELLKQDDEGNHWFHKLTPGKQRSLLYIIGKPKNPDIRLRKAITILDYLKTTKGKLNFEELIDALKAR